MKKIISNLFVKDICKRRLLVKLLLWVCCLEGIVISFPWIKAKKASWLIFTNALVLHLLAPSCCQKQCILRLIDNFNIKFNRLCFNKYFFSTKECMLMMKQVTNSCWLIPAWATDLFIFFTVCLQYLTARLFYIKMCLFIVMPIDTPNNNFLKGIFKDNEWHTCFMLDSFHGYWSSEQTFKNQ